MATNRVLNDVSLKTSADLNKVSVAKKVTLTEVKPISGTRTSSVTAVNSATVKAAVDKVNAAAAAKTDKLFQFTTEAGVSKLELVGTNELKLSDVKKELAERLNVIRKPNERFVFDEFRAMEEMEGILFQKDPSLPNYPSSPLLLSVDPNGGVKCTYIPMYGSGVMYFNTYKLERKKEKISVEEPKVGGVLQRVSKSKTETTLQKVSGIEKAGTRTMVQLDNPWVAIESRDIPSYGLAFVVNDSTVEEGCKYTYRLTVKNITANTTITKEESILYRKLNISVGKFEACPDLIEKQIKVTCSVSNASVMTVYRKDNKREWCSDSFVDTDVELNKTYEYVLEASNYWETIQKSVKVTCSNLTPSMVNISDPKKDAVERAVTLEWPEASNVSYFSVERSPAKENSWKVICDKTTYNSHRDIDDSSFEDGKILKVGETYNYRVKAYNGWGSATSNVVSVTMTNGAPKTPRILPPDGTTLRWTKIDDAKEYYVERTDSPSKYNWTNKQTKNSISDPNAEPGKLYTYKIVTRNGWGKARACFCDVKLKKEENGRLQDCYDYIGEKKCDSLDDSSKKGKKNWRSDLQGITTDGTKWYIANGGYPSYLTWANVDQSLNRYIYRDYTSPDDIHFGDLDYYKGYLFVPAYEETKKNPAQIWIFDTDCKLIEKHDLVKGNGICFKSLGWCAVNPSDGRLYTSENNIKSGSPLYSFKINLDKIKTGKNVFTDPQTLYLYDENGNLVEKEAMQGGCFDDYNNIYLNSGFGPKDHEGVHVFKLNRDDSEQLVQRLANQTEDACAEIYERYCSGDLNLPFVCTQGVLIAKSSKDDNALFKYQFDNSHKWFDKLDPLDVDDADHYVEEPEGMVYYDFSNGPVEPYHDYMKRASLLVSLLHNLGATDYAYLKSYAHLFRETEERNVYYNPENLNVVSAVEASDDGGNKTVYKIVDNGILVKKFTSKDYANDALEILKKFDKIHTIGWLYTSSPNHNYEFSVLESNKSLSDSCSKCTTIEYSDAAIIHEDESELWKVKIKSAQGKIYHFYAHNEDDANKILGILAKYSKLCYIGEGPTSLGMFVFAYRFRSANNLIWLEN